MRRSKQYHPLAAKSSWRIGKKYNLKAEEPQCFLTHSFNLPSAHVSCNQRWVSTATGIAVELESSAWGEEGHTNVAEVDGAGWSWEAAACPLQPAPSFWNSRKTLLAASPFNLCYPVALQCGRSCLMAHESGCLKILACNSSDWEGWGLLSLHSSGLCCPGAAAFTTDLDLFIWKSSSV